MIVKVKNGESVPYYDSLPTALDDVKIFKDCLKHYAVKPENIYEINDDTTYKEAIA